jgi:hypothetical protein
MFNRKSLVTYLIVFTIITFAIGNFAFGSAANKSWKASPDLVKKLTNQRSETNYSEERVPKYTLPNPLKLSDGSRVTNAQTWRMKRHPEILELFRKYVYGRAPIARPENMSFDVFDLERKALSGLATRKQVTVNFTGAVEGPKMDILIYLPNAAEKPVPTFVLLNFGGNHTICSDPAIKLSRSWMRPGRGGVVKNRAIEESRGKASSRFHVEKILERGYLSSINSSTASVLQMPGVRSGHGHGG